MRNPTAEVRDQLWARSAWVFDMDGTLTLAAHDFDAIRARLRLPVGRPILESLDELAARDPELAAAKHRELDELELEIAGASKAAEGARQLLGQLQGAGKRLGVLTRNSRRNAVVTLHAAGLGDFFAKQDVLGRDDAPHKPDPAGILRLLGGWATRPADAVMVGDYRFDLEAGRAAGTMTLYVDAARTFMFEGLADLSVGSLREVGPASATK